MNWYSRYAGKSGALTDTEDTEKCRAHRGDALCGRFAGRGTRKFALWPQLRSVPSVSFHIWLVPLMALMLAGFTTGCFQIETRVQVHEDGSATITERFQLSRRLLEFEQSGGTGVVLSAELTKEALLERMKLMGKGIKLVSHTVRDGEAGSRESVAVFEIPDVTEFQYASPYLSLPGYKGRCLMKGQAVPRNFTDNYNPPGYVYLSFEPVVNDPVKAKVDPPPPPPKPGDPPPKGPTPLDLQMLRHMQPVIRDMLDGLRLRFTIESYAVMYAGWGAPGVRNGSSNTHEIDIIDISDKNLDAYGANILENEEVMLELQQLQFDGPNLRHHQEGYIGNLTLPLLLGRAQPAIFKPSRYFYDKLYTGKSIDYGPHGGGSRPASFEEIGWKPAPSAAK